MGGKDSNYQIVYRGEVLERFVEGGWVFFQRPKSCGGGFWFGRTYSGLFWLEFERPTSLHDGLKYLVSYNSIYDKALIFDDDFDLT